MIYTALLFKNLTIVLFLLQSSSGLCFTYQKQSPLIFTWPFFKLCVYVCIYYMSRHSPVFFWLVGVFSRYLKVLETPVDWRPETQGKGTGG